ncbi:aspartic peptidase domain-containing protein [Podospora appendiculata]|uniref:Aspartic peptidase domain-containing protein n=1 Tax=Podospora appendiculata TaxID=314037 RepID=A0AAE0XBF4_9PEZI|nr:aspartic peptidase domain-containing protein [Podospora appendiculata]
MRRRPPTIATRIVPPDPNRVVSSSSSSPPPVNLNTTAFFKDVAYGVKMWIGEPPQAVTLDFDTGSSETWLDPPCTILGLYPMYEALCRSLGTYIPQQSQHSLDNNVSCPPHWVYYGSGEVFIRYYKDKIAFQGQPEIHIGSAQFGLAIFSEGMPSGIFGAAYGVGYNQNYSSIIDEMYSQGLILDKDFSIALGSVNEDNGELLFGALDLAKFSGVLKAVDIASQHSRREDGYYRYWINVTSIGVTEPGSCLSIPLTNSTFEERFLPDTGTTLTYMPRDALLGLLEFFPDATVEEGYGYKIDCSHLHDEGTIDFGFGSGDFTIRVPYRDFIFQLQPGVEEPDQTEVVCMLGAVPSENFFILGDTFMRSVYAVFRQQEHKVYLAPYQNCGTEIVSSHGEISEVYGVCIPGESFDPPELYGFPPSVSLSATTATCSSYSTGTYSPPQTSTGAATWQADNLPKVWPSTVSSDWWTTATTETEEFTTTTQSRVFTRSAETTPTDTTSSSSSSSSTAVDGYVTLWSWTPVEGPPPPTDLPRAAAAKFYQHDYAKPAVDKKPWRKRSRISEVDREKKGCRMTPCLRTMQERRNLMRAVAFCRQVVGEEGVVLVEGKGGNWEESVPRYLLTGCVGRVDRRAVGEGSVRENVVGACRCLVGTIEEVKGEVHVGV